MIFVEVFRLLLVIAGTIGGNAVGNDIGRNTTAPVIGITLGALISYLLGGVIGRLIDRGLRGAVLQLRSVSAGSVFAGSVVGTTGLLLGLVAGLPVVALVHSSIDYPLVAAFAWVLCAAGVRIGVAKGQEIVKAAGMSHLVDRPAQPPPGTALLVDSSAVMDRHLMVLGRSGLLAGGVVVPRFVVDEVRMLSHSPDPVTSRRAHRGLEAVEALQADGVDIWMNEDEVPELEDTGDARHRPHAPPARPPGHVLGRGGRAGRGTGHRRRGPAPAGRRALPRPPSGRAPRHRPGQRGTPAPTGRRLPARGRHGRRQRRVAPRGAARRSRSSSPRRARRARDSSSSPSSSRAGPRSSSRRARAEPAARSQAQAALTAATSLDRESLASPKSMVVFGS